ncbi:oxygenase MpaB family protein [Cesiribacter sp. SM1]|uniref:oxygenase MpaB family protein n=1 Tax=Cesiribacter sp. SM1 TaxID=2861196 RepID=UPI001CD4A29E|nr:oxygenase MpaB family protein [Cesiribacter sp. SM1]
MEFFVRKGSIVREIWGKSDTILFIFAGAAAEFALNKAVDWLYFTGRLPEDPLGRLFSTVAYARQIVFAPKEVAVSAIDKIAAIHGAVESKRGAKIPDWAYRDVLFMLIDYSIRAFELVERKLTITEREDVFDVFYRVGDRMGIQGLPQTYQQWLVMRQEHLEADLAHSHYTDDLYKQYQKHLGTFRYRILREAQLLVVPAIVSRLLGMGRVSVLAPVVPVYKVSRLVKLDWLIKSLLLPSDYKEEISSLDQRPS